MLKLIVSYGCVPLGICLLLLLLSFPWKSIVAVLAYFCLLCCGSLIGLLVSRLHWHIDLKRPDHLEKSTRPEVAFFFISLLEVVLHTKPVLGVWDVGFFVWLVYVLFIWLFFFKEYLFFLCASYLQYFEMEFFYNFFAFLSLTRFYKTICGGRIGPEINLSGNRNLLWEK